MKEHKIEIELWEIKTDCYGPYNRYAIGYSDQFGTIEGTMKESDCSLPIGQYRHEKREVIIAEFFSGRCLIAKVL